MRALVFGFFIVAALAGRAEAYPQFQLAKDQTCSGCHISPSGGGQLTENGMTVAETISKFGTAPEFMYGKVKTPDWLVLGGDLRYAYGYLQAPQKYLLGFPMQGDLYATARKKQFTAHVIAGIRPPREDEPLTYFWSRQHWVMWQQEEGASEGLFVRAGRFMPVFGLRFAEHPIYTRRFGGTPLYADTYAASASYVSALYEAHVTGWVKDPLIDPVQRTNGVSSYAEVSLDAQTSFGAGGMFEVSDYDHKYRGTLTFKRYLPGPDALISAELQLVNPHVGDYGYKQLVGYVMGTWFAGGGLMIDVGYGHFDENIRIRTLDRDCFDLNIHWFATSHIELALTSRVELIGKGEGGPTGAYSLLMGHYRL